MRLVHACRFGLTHTLNVETELEQGGWPARIDGFGRAEVDFFFSPLHNIVKAELRRQYPHFYDEGRGREFHWPVGDEFLSSFPPVLTPGRYVCTSEFLLRECADKLIDNRFAELALRGINGITLITSNHALERLARVQAVHQIMLPNAGILRAHSESMLAQIDKVIGKTVRIEAAEHLHDKHPIAVYPGYHDFGGGACNAFTQTVTLCLDKYSDFVAASLSEYSGAADRLVAPRQQLQYWRPLNPAPSRYWRY